MKEAENGRSRRRRLSLDGRQQIAVLVEKLGQVAAATLLGVSVQTLAVLAAGFRANASTVGHVEHRLGELRQS